MFKRLLSVTFCLSLVVLPAGPAMAGGGCGSDPTSDTGAQVALRHACFVPTLLRVQPGTEVTFVNLDNIPHIVTGANNRWGSDQLTGGQTYSQYFAQVGVFPYSCALHLGMTGVIVVEGEGVSAAGSAGKSTDTAALISSAPAPSGVDDVEEARVLGAQAPGRGPAGWIVGGVVGALALFVLIVRRLTASTG